MKIEDYAMIGDLETAALVGRDGSIDWLCWPRFDSGACFAALLGDADNGRWMLGAADPAAKTTRAYEPGTLVLETSIETPQGVATVTDFMPPRGQNSDVVRIVRGVRGTVRLRVELTIRFDYGSLMPWVRRRDDGCLTAIAGPDMAVLRTTVPLEPHGARHMAEFDVSQGETQSFVLTYRASHLPLPEAIDPLAALADTRELWSTWSGRFKGAGEWTAIAQRSLITLKALTYNPTGGIVAAATTSLPEEIGGERNWDYRYCWIRDAALTLLALMNAGYYEEADAWRQWLLRAIAGDASKVQIMYGLGGERRLAEYTVPWLPGYEKSQPVRIGNAASEQVQLDIYGELMDALYQARKGGLSESPVEWSVQCEMLKHLEAVWDQPDEGIWEVRGGRRQFTWSKIMCWVAFDRAIKTIEDFGNEGPLDRWRELRDRIHADVCSKGFDANANAFVQSYGSTDLDASLLLIPGMGFLPGNDPRVRGTVEAIEAKLMPDGFVLRYDTSARADGLAGREGAFLACSFWMVEALGHLNRTDDALALFRRLVALCNDLGLLSEEFDWKAGRQVGNFPQAFSHIALAYTAISLAQAGKPDAMRPG